MTVETEDSSLYGVDGARGGWAVVHATPDLKNLGITMLDDLDTLFESVMAERALLAIDVPIGLPESKPRTCDRAARKMLGQPRGSSVFPAPMRVALSANSYDDACSLNEGASGRRLSRQSYHILDKIRGVDELMSPERQDWIFEAHPEVTFMMLCGAERGLRSNKKKPNGRSERAAILEHFLPHLDLSSLYASVKQRGVQRDDVHDAVACLLTAWRRAAGQAITLPIDEERDARGLRMEIVA